ncbi:MAG: peptide MFS transporter [Bacteroidales bacterium]|nr:peptide MFS transporter [Bacteroidales bacterium]
MLKDHPRGLFVAFFANMGERFGFYTMVAIFILFLQAKYGFPAGKASQIYGAFMFFVYFLPLLGGIIADKVLGYGKTISIGLVVMFLGYFLLAMPTTMGTGQGAVFLALGVIALGTGLFKGNLQALVGNLYDDPKYSSKRDIAFNIFYMGINIGAMFAPTAAEKVSNWILHKSNFFYDARIPALANSFLKGQELDINHFLTIAQAQDSSTTLDTLRLFSENYINALSKSYHFGFGVACVSLIISMLIFWGFRKYYRQADFSEKQKAARADMKDQVIKLTPKQTRERLIALGLVFFVVIFFWMSFHQNGLTLTFFARDYTQPSVGKGMNFWFDLFGLLPIFLSVIGLYFMLRKKSITRDRLLGGVAFVGFAVLAYLRYRSYGEVNPFTPQKFQHFNPFFIVALTPIIVGIFGYMNRKGIEPPAPKKIGIGMLITAVGFIIMVFGSLSLIGYSPKELAGQVAPVEHLVSPYWLISTYFTLTVAELFLSPMGISFVSRVAPPQYKGLMQGGWFAATALGNYLLSVIGALWSRIPLWSLWLVLVICCILSAVFIFAVMKRLLRATQS